MREYFVIFGIIFCVIFTIYYIWGKDIKKLFASEAKGVKTSEPAKPSDSHGGHHSKKKTDYFVIIWNSLATIVILLVVILAIVYGPSLGKQAWHAIDYHTDTPKLVYATSQPYTLKRGQDPIRVLIHVNAHYRCVEVNGKCFKNKPQGKAEVIDCGGNEFDIDSGDEISYVDLMFYDKQSGDEVTIIVYQTQ